MPVSQNLLVAVAALAAAVAVAATAASAQTTTQAATTTTTSANGTTLSILGGAASIRAVPTTAGNPNVTLTLRWAGRRPAWRAARWRASCSAKARRAAAT
jgi:hypothetical protein